MSDDPISKNRAYWNAWSRSYQEEHGPTLEGSLAWGVWRIPESRLEVLDPVAGRRVLELGCGAAQWGVELARSGASTYGLDLSQAQLIHARERMRRLGVRLPVVQANAERLPFRDGSFEIVFCDHGAFSFTRPEHTVAEAARVLVPAGQLAFCMSTPLLDICWDQAIGAVGERLKSDYFGLTALEDKGLVSFQLPYGSWIRLFRRHALVVEDLIELLPGADAQTSYSDYVSLEWAQRWPAEHIWKLRKVSQ